MGNRDLGLIPDTSASPPTPPTSLSTDFTSSALGRPWTHAAVNLRAWTTTTASQLVSGQLLSPLLFIPYAVYLSPTPMRTCQGLVINSRMKNQSLTRSGPHPALQPRPTPFSLAASALAASLCYIPHSFCLDSLPSPSSTASSFGSQLKHPFLWEVFQAPWSKSKSPYLKNKTIINFHGTL